MVNAHERLTVALLSLTDRNERPPCGDPGTSDLWTSEDADERAQAARWCHGCPISDACSDAANETGERFGVWAGFDRTTTQTRKRAS